MKKSILLILFLLFVISVFAQNHTDTLKDVLIKEKIKPALKNEFAPGIKVMTIDSNTLQQYHMQQMATMLSQQTSVFVKSYGVNGLSTLSFRGASAAQSGVWWNGVPIQNAALGVADAGALPVFFMNSVRIAYGSTAALWGSGNVGGALLLDSKPVVFDSGKKSLAVSCGGGSFGNTSIGIEGEVAYKRLFVSVKTFSQSALNHFPYQDGNGKHQNMNNSHLTDNAVQLQMGYKLSKSSVISIAGWYQMYDRQIPPALFETSSDKRETDKSLRLVADFINHHNNNTWYAKSSFIQDGINYIDTVVGLRTANTSYQYYQELGWRKQWYEYGRLLVFAPVQMSWMRTDSGNKQQAKTAIAASYDIALLHNKIDLAVNIRDEVSNGNNICLPGADAAYSLTDWLLLKANMQETYRLPTLNELYYNPGGNKDLRPEQGWNEDAGYTLQAVSGRWSLYSDGAVYDRQIQDWILWLGGAIWTPHNIAKVHSRGIETENKLEYATGKWKLSLGITTGFTLSTTISSYQPNDGSIGRQLPYTPRYNGNAKAGVQYKNLYLAYIQTYTGYRFITADESEYLPPYSTGNVLLMYKCNLYKHNLQLTAQCNNIWNEQYQVVADRPMPGINWLAGVQFGVW